MPNNKSAEKRLRTADKNAVRNKAVRSEIRTGIKKIRAAESKEAVLNEMPGFYSILDKAANKHRAGFTKNRVANYKRKVSKVLNSFS